MLSPVRSSHDAADLRSDREDACPSFSMLGGGKVIAEIEEVVERVCGKFSPHSAIGR